MSYISPYRPVEKITLKKLEKVYILASLTLKVNQPVPKMQPMKNKQGLRARNSRPSDVSTESMNKVKE